MEEQNLTPQNESIEEKQPVSSQDEVITAEIDENKLEDYLKSLRFEQNFSRAIIAGSLAMLIGAILWAFITVTTMYQIGYMAVAVGFIVGYAVRYAGKGVDQVFGITGAVLAFLGCLLGNFFSMVGLLANELQTGIFDVFSLIPLSTIIDVMGENFAIMDLLFYGIAIYEGYKFSFRVISDEDILANASKPTV